MFRNLLGFWQGRDFLAEVFDQFRQMLEDSADMFEAVRGKLLNGGDIPDLKNRIYESDRKINRLEKDIRRRIVEHLSLQPAVDVTACLLLMSVVKDAERLGDYCKNLYEASTLLSRPVDKEFFTRLFGDIDKQITMLFAQSREAFVESNDHKAIKSWEFESRIAKRCDKAIEELATSEVDVNVAVCMALIARYFKRTAVHLTNIATSVILPLSEIDYFKQEKNNE